LLAWAWFTALIAAGAAPAQPAQEKPAPQKIEAKRWAVSFKNKPWSQVLEWLVDETGLPLVSTAVPTGTFTCVSPPGRTYTLPEVIDLVNEGLMAAKYRLYRGSASLTLVPADERPDPALIPTVRPEELATRGRTEVVRVIVSLKGLKANDLAPEVKRLLGPFGEVSTLANRLVVQDTVQNVRQVLKTLQEVDAQAPPAPTGATGAVMRVYPVRPSQAEALTRMLQEIFRKAPGVRITAISDMGILVQGTSEDQDQIQSLLRVLHLPPDTIITELVRLETLPPVRTVDTLKAMFGGPPSGPYLEADERGNAIIVRGTRPQIEEIKSTIKSLGEGPVTGKTLTITLDKGQSAATLADSIERFIRGMRPNPVHVIAPSRKGEAPPKAAVKDGGPQAKHPGQPPPLTLTVLGNKLIATCDDPEVLAMVAELTRQPTQQGGEGNFEIVRLRSTDALAAAKVLTEAFNGPGTGKGPERVRIVADPATNSLLVRASPLDLVTIRRLLETALDSSQEEAEAVARTWIIGPLKHATATELAEVLRSVYRGEARRTGFTITPDPRTNSLLLRSSEALYRDIRHLVEQLDEKARDKVK
jgi:type II secretory pathway component GspD/PulD (secretin)